MDLLSPFTTLIEWVWCAAQVGATYVEIFLFGASLLLLIAVSYHMHRWQKKIMLTLQAVQTQLQENSKADDLVHTLREVKSSMMSMTGTASGDANALKEIHAQLQSLRSAEDGLKDVKAQLQALKLTESEIKNLMTELGVVKKHQLEVVSHMSTVKSMATEVANFHKLLNTVVTDCGKLGGFFNRVTETLGVVVQQPSVQQQEAALEKLQKAIEEFLIRMQKQLNDKIEEVSERMTVLRVVMDQKHDKACTMYKDLNGSTCSDIRNLVSLVRGLGPVVPEIKKLVDMVASGREASNCAQQTLQSSAEMVATCEDRLIRLESLTCGLVDQTAECDNKITSGFEALQNDMPILHDILGRLPKLPVRKPPRDNVPTESATTSSGNGTAAPMNFQQPSTPPTTLGPGQAPTIPVQIPVAGQSSPTVIPISVDSGSQGIQLRLSDHLSSQQVGLPQPQPNFLITQLPTQPTTGNNLLQALLQNQR